MIDHTSTEAEAGRYARATADEIDWPETWPLPKGWTVYDEVPELSDLR